jgi:fimbrial chaperone protein
VLFIEKILLLAILATLVLPRPAQAAWRVIPIRLDFDQRTKSGVITLSNDGETSITFAIEAAEWSQDNQGQDRYSPTQDLVFFPKVLTIEPNTERVVRAGIRVPATTHEKTYRLFIKEASEPKKTEGTAVAIAIKFGVPIFAKPVKEELKGEILRPLVAERQIELTVANTGNSHFRIGTVRVAGINSAGEDIFSQEVNGWYLLSGSSSEFSIPIDLGVCTQLKTIDIQMNADRLYLEKKIDVSPAMCVAQ